MIPVKIHHGSGHFFVSFLNIAIASFLVYPPYTFLTKRPLIISVITQYPFIFFSIVIISPLISNCEQLRSKGEQLIDQVASNSLLSQCPVPTDPFQDFNIVRLACPVGPWQVAVSLNTETFRCFPAMRGKGQAHNAVTIVI